MAQYLLAVWQKRGSFFACKVLILSGSTNLEPSPEFRFSEEKGNFFDEIYVLVLTRFSTYFVLIPPSNDGQMWYSNSFSHSTKCCLYIFEVFCSLGFLMFCIKLHVEGRSHEWLDTWKYPVVSKGQLISEQIYCVLSFPKMQDFCPSL